MIDQSKTSKGNQDRIKQAAREESWRRGQLRWKLRQHQRGIYDQIKGAESGSFYFNKARRIGGSYLMCVLAIEVCLSTPGAQVKYAAPTGKAVRKIINPNIRKIIQDCPDDCKPKFSTLEGEWQFPNGSCIAVAGCDNGQAENLRGTESHFVCMDEVGFIDDLEYILNDILAPQIKDTKGLIVLTSTPARSPAHESYKMAAAHRGSGRYAEQRVWEDTHYTREQHEAYFAKMADSKGITLAEYYDSTTFRREYLCEFITDAERAVIPEWNAAVEEYVTNLKDHRFRKPAYYDRYVSMDIGWRDGTGVLFARWDFKRAVLVIEDELLLFKSTSEASAAEIKKKESELWPGEAPFLRISDNQLQTIADFNTHGLTFIPTRKDDKELQVNTLREWVRGRKIWIHPRCKRLLSQLGSTIWNKQRTSYERNQDGHGDLLDALVYLVRNIRRDRNPFPINYGIETGFDWIVHEQESTPATALEEAIISGFAMELDDE